MRELLLNIQEITVKTIDGVKVEEYTKFLEVLCSCNKLCRIITICGFMQDKPHFILKAAHCGLTEVIKTMLILDGELVNEHDEVNL